MDILGGRGAGYFISCSVVNAGKMVRKSAEMALARVVNVGENKLAI